MKKLLTLLLTLVMAVCLVSLNNRHTEADEGNTPYTYEYKSTGWDPASTETSYNFGDKITLKNSTADKSISSNINGDIAWINPGNSKEYTVKYIGAKLTIKGTGSNLGSATITDVGEYTYTFTHTTMPAAGTWEPESTKASYNVGETIGIISPNAESDITIKLNGELFKTLNNKMYTYTIENSGATISIWYDTVAATGIMEITDMAPTPTPSPSEPVVKDESCEKVIGPTWHWNETKGICEEYATVGTSTRWLYINNSLNGAIKLNVV